ncbi:MULTISPECIES: DNA topoisomerase III [unclassified Gilliamella]|uniref:DNA topoisomerase III n=1 Tax=unclassified Gilliamella TaxID=2685620 RepID=UPI00226ADAFF|nr:MULTISPECIES: DNA topoisomerase III [unclassified Gilliamella]MCX8602222.1 DNA topoisomerase III [Gilliamella sp. B3722]MCX8607206.1 DNA topoisomerase III [Gilliamella sp. B3771]MCX8611492.1 DNA topoisomerase III [Gilliamella sp. B3891]MCX8613962.1 DNA topoisomerase III [Gilliamella sp. B3773]MCX8614938.1 DNA topoisomerase III [Gilliamella sp. B3770]
MQSNQSYRLFIAEKPSLARAIADVLPKPHQKGNGFIKAGNGDIVSWCIGHLLEQATPEVYDQRYKKWQVNDLPIVPEKWILMPKSNTAKQFNILVDLIKSADQIVHAGDPDREGQLLVDEVLNYCKLPDTKRKSIQRCLISDLNASAVEKSLQQLRSNQEFIPLSTSALARARADWLYGINMSRVCTIVGQKSGYRGVLSIGRVQTPILGLVVRRDIDIEQFVPKPFYEVYAVLETEHNEKFKAKWQPSEACAPYQDEEGRVLVKALAENVCQRIINQTGTVEKVSNKKKELAPPLPFNLSALQIEMAKKNGLSAQDVLDICQALYEKHKLITYPRSDCRFLPQEHIEQINGVKSAIENNCPELKTAIDNADFTLRTKTWNDKKVEAHHAIIPTLRKARMENLTENEKAVYQVIATQYLAQFYPAYKYAELQIDVDIVGGKFISKTNQMLDEGWKVLFRSKNYQNDNDNPNNESSGVLTKLVKKGESVQCVDTELLSKETQPPKPFTDATLLSAMTGIARFVKDPEIKKILRETDGLGTEATRAGIIELLFKRQFLTRQGKTIRSTPVGRNLILSLPEMMSMPDMTAHWEMQLDEISKKEFSYQQFMDQLNISLLSLVGQLKNSRLKIGN